ncbi:MAG: HAMP domain-containing histidine kinase [Bacteroidetes bacterium]|nr:HAMP domain-containing histidine kinase [Bacteroidota bacterium]
MKTIFLRVFSIMILLSCIILIAQAAINYGYQFSSVKTWYEDIVSQYQEVFYRELNNAGKYQFYSDTLSLQMLVEETLNDDRILSVQFLDTNDTAVFSVNNQISKGGRVNFSPKSEETYFSQFFTSSNAFPVILDGTELGTLSITSLAPLRYTLTQDFFNKTFLVFLISLPISFIIAFIFSLIFSKRISIVPVMLSKELKELAEGKRNVKFSESSIREFAMISDSASTLQNKLVQTQRNRTEFMNNLAHDLKTPVTALKVQVEGLLDGVFPPEPTLFNNLNIQVQDLQEKVDAFLQISRLESSDTIIHPELCDLGVLLKKCSAGFLDLIKEKALKHSIEIQKQVAVLADKKLILFAFRNIIHNMIRFSDDRGTVYINLSGKHDKAEVIFENTGHLDHENPEKLFDHLSKGSISRGSSGSGLGLTIARRILESHHGTITLENIPGGKVRVSVVLPYCSG